MPIYGPDLYQLQKLRERQPFPLPFVWALTAQLVAALEALCTVGIVHADIKPQNVVVQRSDAPIDASARVTLVDLGSCLTREQLGVQSTKCGAYIQSRWYRAPEVLLSASISHAADAWSVGCVIAEVALGVPLLPGESEHNQLARIVASLGPPPPSLLARSRRAGQFFRRRGKDEVLLRTSTHEPRLVRYLPYDQINALVDHLLPRLDERERAALLCILDGFLRWDPHNRWSGSSLMQQLLSKLKAIGVQWPLPCQDAQQYSRRGSEVGLRAPTADLREINALAPKSDSLVGGCPS